MKVFILLLLLEVYSALTLAQINYDEAVSGDLGSSFTEMFTAEGGNNQWQGTIDATPPSNADTWIIIVPEGYVLDTMFYERSVANGTITFLFDACLSGLPNTTESGLEGFFIPPLGPGSYCIQIVTDFLTDPVTWSVDIHLTPANDPCADLGGDSDGDGVCDNDDGCPDDPDKSGPGVCGCGVADTDTDGDLVADCNDNCPAVANADQNDLDDDGSGDACDDLVNIGGAGDNLIEVIENLGLPGGLETSMLAKIQNAMESCANGNEEAAINQLYAFINQVEAKRGNPLTDEEADQLIAMAQAMIDAIENGTADCGIAPMIYVPGDPLAEEIEIPFSTGSDDSVNNDPEIIAGASSPENFQLDAYPNPGFGEINFRFELTDSENISLIIYDIYGKELAKIADAISFEPGIHKIAWHPTNLEGIYIARLTSESLEATAQIVIQ